MFFLKNYLFSSEMENIVWNRESNSVSTALYSSALTTRLYRPIDLRL